MKINSINFLPVKPIKEILAKFKNGAKLFSFQGAVLDKSVLVSKGIIKEDTDLDAFFDEISFKIFNENNQEFSSALKRGEISLSSMAYNNIKFPYSAIATALDENKSDGYNLSRIEEYIRNGMSIGINFSNFENPTDEINKVNKYLKYREPNIQRPPAAIGLLNINHPKIIDFIKLKYIPDFSNWCFDLSVVIDDDFMKKLENNDAQASEIYRILLDSMNKSSEPGIIFSNKKNYLCDCCAAAPLNEGEKLTLGQVNLSKFCSNNKFDFEKLKKDTQLLCSAMKKIDENSYISVLGYQDLLNKMNLKYGSDEALSLTEQIMTVISKTAHDNNIKTAISPTGGVSRLLKTTPSIEPDIPDSISEIKTMAVFQKYLDGNISKTLLLNDNSTTDDVDNIVKMAYKSGLRGITVHHNINS